MDTYLIDVSSSWDFDFSRLKHLLSSLLDITDLFSFQDWYFDWTHPVVVFWKSIKDFLDSISGPLLNRGVIFGRLLKRLLDTLRALPSIEQQTSLDGHELTTEFSEEFIRLCFDVQLQLFGLELMNTSAKWIDDLTIDEVQILSTEVSDAKAIIASRLTLGDHKVNAIWDECYSSLIIKGRERIMW